jgi:hypothetical protein
VEACANITTHLEPTLGALFLRRAHPGPGPPSQHPPQAVEGAVLIWYSSQFKNNHYTEIHCGSEAGSYLRLIDSCITQLKFQGPSRACNESNEDIQDPVLAASTRRRLSRVAVEGASIGFL